MIKLSDHSKQLIKYQEKILYYVDREVKFKEIYDKANALLAVVGAEGEINSQDSVCDDLMSALFSFDGGTFETEKMFPKYQDIE